MFYYNIDDRNSVLKKFKYSKDNTNIFTKGDRPKLVGLDDKIKLSLYAKQLNKIRNGGLLTIE